MSNFHVYIIESPSSVDLYHKRFEGESLQKTLTLSGIPCSHTLTVNKDAFEAAFYVGLKEYFTYNNVPPLIHISAHGDSHGIELTSRERVDWNALKELLKPLNKVLNGGLLVSMSACEGSSGCAMSMYDDNFPFFAVIGSCGSPTWAETNIAYSTFYHLFNKGKTVEEAVNAMNIASGNPNFKVIASTTARQAYLSVINKEYAVDTMETNIPDNKTKSDLSKALGS